MSDTQEKLWRTIWKARFAAAIVGNALTRDYELLDVDKALPASEGSLLSFRERNLRFIGVIALHEDGPRVGLEEELDEQTTAAILQRFLSRIEGEINARLARLRVGDEVEWLQRLQELPDPRGGVPN